ncbi:MAG: galactose mutarotase [Chitinophagaceae bacterium]|nr:galactose mutarotase [Chitinophagaceae bacterium]
MLPHKLNFSKSIHGKATELYLLNIGSFSAAVTNYGARLVSLLVPDKNGKQADVVVGFDNIEGYITASERYYGATVGRYANRIAKGRFTLDGTEYSLTKNIGDNHLHGGIKGFQEVVWDVDQLSETKVIFTYLSEDGEEGYPGNLKTSVTYEIVDNNSLQINFNATTDKPTIVNLTNHSYFNLNVQGSGSILEHSLTINADNFTPTDEVSIPLGTIEPVTDTPFDFRQSRKIGERINAKHLQLLNGKGYDHNFALNKASIKELSWAATAVGDKSGIIMKVFTQEPGMQLYTGNFMKGDNIIKGGYRDEYRTAFCLETQHFPDSPNHTKFPSTVLRPGEIYDTTTVFRFS